jgi:two-component system sensor histidine kinase/response regulator
VVRCIEMGAEDYLPKPFNPTLLKARIGACLEKKRLWDELRKNYERLQALERLRDDLTHMIVHDLRTPLTRNIGGLQMILHGRIDPHSPAAAEMGAIALSGAHSLLGMINDLLDISKMEGGSLRLERRELRAADLVDYALQQVTALAQERSLQMVRDLPDETVLFRGDEEKLRRILVNLLGNAIKFSPTGGTVTTFARWQEDENAMLFAVRDTGEGIPPEATQRIFEKFGQVETRKAGRKMSTGLGLAFCKLAVEAHGGQIWVESEPGQGSTFSFSLPLPSNARAIS